MSGFGWREPAAHPRHRNCTAHAQPFGPASEHVVAGQDHDAMAEAARPLGDRFEVLERLVVSPAAGIFKPDVSIVAGGPITAGTVVGAVADHDIRCPFDGELQAFIATTGERLRSQQPIAWLRTTGHADAA